MSSRAFNADELEAQSRAGTRPGGGGIRNFMPEQHRSFFRGIPEIFVATVDADGWPLATVLEGEPGFVHSPDPKTLRIDARPESSDPAAGMLRVAGDVGVLGIDLGTRRRNRVNGIVTELDTAGFTIAVKESFGNCPQYIQRRALQRADAAGEGVRTLTAPDDRARELIERVDTFFVASHSSARLGSSGGADISHRGGRPGFVRVDGSVLSIPDFRGNGYFNTLGNLLGEPRCALLFVDFESGDVIQLQGRARIDWSTAERVAGAERVWHFHMARGWYRPRAAAMRGELIDYSPVTLRTGTWVAGAGLNPADRTASPR
jgi:predicted pyridoxine 5'-phosphate oxidase superfamily flavin-nucleotide-binding protein